MATVTYQSPWMNDELRMFRSTVRKFIQKEFVPQQERWRQQHCPDADAWKKAGDLGILLPSVPEEYGGGGGTFAHEAVVIEELAQACVNFGASVQSIVAQYILAYGNKEQKSNWISCMARGELVAAIAMTEPGAGSDLQRIQTRAHREGNNYVINGSKTFITNGFHANLICLAVKTDEKAAGLNGISLIIVEAKNLRGYHVGRPLEKIGTHGQDTCELFFNDVRVPAQNLLGPVVGKGFFQMMEQLPFERLAIGVSAVATMEHAVAITSKYVKERMVFGKPMIDLQNTRFKLAECKTEAHIGRVFVDSCIQRFIASQFDPVTAAMAKYWLTDCQSRIVDECLQMHGGYGYMVEYPIARMWTDCRMQRIGGGANEVMKDMIGWSV